MGVIRVFHRESDPRLADQRPIPVTTVPTAAPAVPPVAASNPPAPVLPPLPTADEAQARLTVARQAIADHEARIAALDANLNDVKQHGQDAAPGSAERRAAGVQIASLSAELEFEQGDRPALDEALRLALVDMAAVQHKLDRRGQRQYAVDVSAASARVAAARQALDEALREEQNQKMQFGHWDSVRGQSVKRLRDAGATDAEMQRISTQVHYELDEEENHENH